MANQLPSLPPLTLKERIIQLLQSSNPRYSDQEIAGKVDTTLQYVRKIKCLHRGKELTRSTTPQPVHESPAGNGQEQSQSQRRYAPSQPPEPTLGFKDRIKAWSMFNQGIKPTDVIIGTGYPPEWVEHEYKMHLKFKYINLDDIQRKLVESIAQSMDYVKRLHPGIQEVYTSIYDSYKVKGFLETNQHLHLEEINELINLQRGKDSIKNVSESLPYPWARIPCSICGGPLDGAVFDSTDKMGIKILKYCKGWCHTACLKKREEAKRKDAAEA